MYVLKSLKIVPSQLSIYTPILSSSLNQIIFYIYFLYFYIILLLMTYLPGHLQTHILNLRRAPMTDRPLLHCR